MTTKEKLQLILLMLQKLNKFIKEADENGPILGCFKPTKEQVIQLIDKKIAVTEGYLQRPPFYADVFIKMIGIFINKSFRKIKMVHNDSRGLSAPEISSVYEIIKPCIFMFEHEDDLKEIGEEIFLSTELIFPENIRSYEEKIMYCLGNKSMHIVNIDSFFEDLESKTQEQQLECLKGENINEYIARKGNFYTLYRYFKILSALPEKMLVDALSFLNEYKLSYYLIGARWKSDYTYQYALNNFLNLLSKLPYGVRKDILNDIHLQDRIYYESDTKSFCTYLLLLEDPNDLLLPTDYQRNYRSNPHPNRQQELFRYIKNEILRYNRMELLDIALSSKSALNSFLIKTPCGIYCFMFYMFPSAHFYVKELRELKKRLIEIKSSSKLSNQSIFNDKNIPKNIEWTDTNNKNKTVLTPSRYCVNEGFEYLEIKNFI